MRATSHADRGLDAVRRLVADAIKERSARFLKNLKRALKHPVGDPIHDLRVSMRRLAAALLATGEIRESRIAADVLSQLDALMRPLGKVRDAQVQLGLLGALGKRGAKTVSAFTDLLEQREARFRAKSQKAMKRLDAARIRKGCKQVQAELDGETSASHSALRSRPKGSVESRCGDEAARQAAARTAYRILLRCYRAVRSHRLRALNRRDLEALHKMRLALKRMRYTAEVLQSALPELTGGRLKLFGRYQTYMGDIHDLDVLAGNIREFYGATAAPAVHRVVERLTRRRERIFKQFRKSFGALEKSHFLTQ